MSTEKCYPNTTYYHICSEEVTHSGLSVSGTLELEGAESLSEKPLVQYM